MGDMERRVYVLPGPLLDRLRHYQRKHGIRSEVEAVRSLLDASLRDGDTAGTIASRVAAAVDDGASLRDAARAVLALHPQVTDISFEDRALPFVLADRPHGWVSDQGESWGAAADTTRGDAAARGGGDE